jgi:hypothetical protein
MNQPTNVNLTPGSRIVARNEPYRIGVGHSPKIAMRHYEVGVRIGELSLSPGFERHGK